MRQCNSRINIRFDLSHSWYTAAWYQEEISSQSRISRTHHSPYVLIHYLQYSWLPDVFRIHGSVRTCSVTISFSQDCISIQVIGHIIGPVLTVTIFAAIVAYLWHIGQPVLLTNSVVPLLSVVVRLHWAFYSNSTLKTSLCLFYDGRLVLFWSSGQCIKPSVRGIWLTAIFHNRNGYGFYNYYTWEAHALHKERLTIAIGKAGKLLVPLRPMYGYSEKLSMVVNHGFLDS